MIERMQGRPEGSGGKSPPGPELENSKRMDGNGIPPDTEKRGL
jgi:hypothetical protein